MKHVSLFIMQKPVSDYHDYRKSPAHSPETNFHSFTEYENGCLLIF